MCVNEGTAFAI